MGRILGAICAWFACFAGPVWASEEAAERLRQIEAQGLQAVSPERLDTLLREPVPSKPAGVEYTAEWLNSQPEPEGGPDLRCLSEALYFEARGETVKGQFAVAEVIMNRVASGRFPDTVCGVINQGTGKRYQCQFTYTCDGLKEVIHNRSAYDRVARVARAVLDGRGEKLTGGATHYHTTSVNPKWAGVYTRTATIGVHVFYRHTWRTASN